MIFGEKLRRLRVQWGLTQDELALNLGVTCRTLQNYESGNVYPKKREIYSRLAEFFGTDINYWLSESANDNAPEDRTEHTKTYGLASQVSSFFEDNSLTEEELDDFMRTIQGAYWAAKDKNKNSKKSR